jgi:two-component system sensor histidine kinase/response regulator
MSVLLVEDNLINQQIAIELMQLAGIAVDVAEHGGQALEMLKADKHYDVVLMDLQMPVVDGYSATEAIRRDPTKAKLPIIAMTAYAMSEERQRCLDAGMNDHVSKPIDPDMLFDALARWHDKPESNTNASSSTRQGFKLLNNAGSAPNRIPPKAIDSVAALRRVGGNLGLYHKLLSRFANKASSTIEEIKLAMEQQQKQEAERMAHTVRGVAGNLGAMPLADAACDLELAINADAGNAADYLQVFECRMAEFVEQAQLLLAEPLE